jgi:hypothetical protein
MSCHIPESFSGYKPKPEVVILTNHPFVQCPKCPARILVVPDLKAMRKAINEHAILHCDPDWVKQFLSERAMISIIQVAEHHV